MPWPTDGLRRVSVNSFGYGGANVHCVLDDSYNYLEHRGLQGKHCTARLPPRNVSDDEKAVESHAEDCRSKHIRLDDERLPSPLPTLLVWSAADEDGLKRLATTYQSHMSLLPTPRIEDYMSNLSYTLSDRRSSLPWKAFVVASSPDELAQSLLTDLSKPVRSSGSVALGFIFTGQGAQWARMGCELLVYPVFADSLRKSEAYLYDLGSTWGLIGECCIIMSEATQLTTFR